MTLLTALAMLFGVCFAIGPIKAIPVFAEETSGTCGKDLTWILDDEGVLKITDCGQMQDFCKHQLSKISMQSFPIELYLKGNSTMIDALYNYRQGDIHSAEFSDEFNALGIPFEESLTEAQLTTFQKLLDCVSETAAAEMRVAYKAGFMDGVALMREVQE